MLCLSYSMWNLVPQPENEPQPPALETVLATGPQGKSHMIFLMHTEDVNKVTKREPGAFLYL